jgi:hypothetical protein
MIEILLAVVAYMLIAITPTVMILRRQDEIPQAVLVTVIAAQWVAPVLGWLYAAWVADHDFRDA